MNEAYNLTLKNIKEKKYCETLSFNDNIHNIQDTLYYQQGEFFNMSLVFAYKNESRIILMSESRSSRTINNQSNYIDGFKKIVYLQKADLALITAGPNIIEGKNIIDYFLSIEDKLIGKSTKESLKFITSSINKDIFADNSVLLICANRFKDTAESFSVNITKKEVSPIEETTCLWHNNCKILSLFVEGKDLLIPDFNIYSEKQVIDFLSFLIKSEQKYKEYSGQPNCIGGDIQVLVLDKYGIKEYDI